MTLKFIYQNEILVEKSDKFPCGRNGYYQSDFKITKDNLAVRVSVLATQPIYCNGKGEFQLVPKEIAELMCYSPLRIGKIICHNIRDSGLSSELKEILESLSF